jgi:hypothetical protein
MDTARRSWLLGQSHPVIKLVLIAIRIESEYISISRSFFGWGPKGDPNAPIIAKSEMTDLLRLLKLIWQPDLSMLAIGVEPASRSVTRSLSGWVLKESPMPRSPLRARSWIS